jgi:hypothetical protein
MFCPKCATQNLEGASFCRSCGANISLVPTALSGQLPQARDDDDRYASRRSRRRRSREASLDHAFKNIFMGIAFMLIAVALAFSRMGYGWWFWMLIPAFSLMGSGVAQYIRLKELQKQQFLPGSVGQPLMQPPRRVDEFAPPRRAEEFPARQTGELVPPPPSVTEGTTRHLGAEAPTRHLDESN